MTRIPLVTSGTALGARAAAVAAACAPGLHSMRWLRGFAPGGVEFLTSDVGIVKCKGRPDAFTSWDMGFTEGRDIWIFPLKPEVALMIAPAGGPDLSGPLKPEWIRAVNKHLWVDAYRWVFSRKAIPPNWPAT